MPDWNTMGTGGTNRPLHEKAGPPKRSAPPVPEHGPNKPIHQRSIPHAANTPLHQRVGAPTRSKPPAGGKGKTF